MNERCSLKLCFVAMAIMAFCLSGCSTYRYRIVQPASVVPSVAAQPVHVHYDPLDYTLIRQNDRLAVQINNPTEDKIILLGSRSFVVDPEGESHPIRDRILAPRSFSRLWLPPVPFTYAYPDYSAHGPGYGWGYIGSWYDPLWGPGYGWYGPPPMSYHQVLTSYDWRWKTGPARLRLTYERFEKTFEHDFEFVREKE